VVTLGPASIVVVPFPFSDLSGTKLRPAVVLANAGRNDWLLCQITSNPYSDPNAIRITNKDLQKGVLTSAISFARPLKLFAASETVMDKHIAILNEETFRAILMATIELLQKNLPKL
jgi:mRNA interferase MazF